MNREVVPVRQCFSWLGTAQCSGRSQHVQYRGEAAIIFSVTTLVSSHELSEEHATGSPCILADWSTGSVARNYWGWCSSHRRTWSTLTFDFWVCFTLFSVGVGEVGDFYLLPWRLISGSNLQNPCFITSNVFTKQVWFSLKTLNDVLTQLHVVLLPIIIQPSWNHFCANCPHNQILGDNLLNTVLFPVKVICNHSSNQPIIATHYLPYPLDVVLSSARWRNTAPHVICHLLAHHFKHSKTLVYDLVLSPNSCWSISSASDGIFSTWN